MKSLKCNQCTKTYKEGKFCLDCGQPLVEVITTDVRFNPIKTKRTSDQLKRDIRKWLNRIGVLNPDIQIGSDAISGNAEVEYNLNNNQYTFSSVLQPRLTDNLAAVEQFLHHRVIGIERGIETTEQAFAGYEALPDPKERLSGMTDQQLKKELHLAHPDTGNGDTQYFQELQDERARRKG